MHKSSSDSQNAPSPPFEKTSADASPKDDLSQNPEAHSSVGKVVADESASKGSGPVSDYLGLIGVHSSLKGSKAVARVKEASQQRSDAKEVRMNSAFGLVMVGIDKQIFRNPELPLRAFQ